MAGEKESSNEWQLNKGKLKTGALVRLPGAAEPFGTVVHVTESEALVKRSDTGKREPISLKSEVEFLMPEKTEKAEKTAKETEMSELSKPTKPTKPKKSKASADDIEKPSKPKREKASKPKPEPETEEEIENDTDDSNDTEQEPELSEKKSKSAKEKKEPTAKPKKGKKEAAAVPAPAPASNDWYSAEALSALTGHNPAWIGKNRDELFDDTMYKTDTEAEGRGRKPIVYNRKALEVLKNTPIPTRGGGRRKTSDNGDAPLASMDVRPPKVKASSPASALAEAAPRGRKKASAVAPVSSDPASDALDAIEATISATERQRDAHAARYESLLGRLRQQRDELEFLASGLAG